MVTDNEHQHHRVSVHAQDGRCLRQFGSQGAGNEQFHWPRYVTTDQGPCRGEPRILVADGSNHCVKVFTAQGKYLTKFGSQGAGDGQMKHPRGLAVDPNGGVLVCDQDNNRVSLYGPDGRFVRQVLSVHRPWGLALSERGYVAVTNKQGLHYYKMFDPMP